MIGQDEWARMVGRGLRGLAGVNRHVVVEVLKRDERKEYTLDNDATIIESEKEGAKWTYNGSSSPKTNLTDWTL